MKQIKYALYRDDEILYVGTKEELAKYLNVSVRTIGYYNTPTYKRRVKSGYKVYIIHKKYRPQLMCKVWWLVSYLELSPKNFS